MVRFEKLLWEQVVNTKMLGRERVLGTPKKWFTNQRHKEVRVAAHYFWTGGLRAPFFKVFERTLSWLFYKWPRDYASQKGLAMEDFLLHQDRELRRDYFFEHVIRQSCHPYQHLMFKKRRARYFKVERAVRGFFVPDYLRAEAENVLVSDTLALKDEWEDFVHTHFWSDITPTSRFTAMHRLIPLEIFNVYGILRTEAWDRFFLNEMVYDKYTEEEYKLCQTPFGNFNLDREDGRRSFEAEVNKFAEIYPSTITRPGEKFDFKRFYAKYALVKGKDTTKLDPKLVEELRTKLQAPESAEISSYHLPAKKVGKSIIGTVFPTRLREKYSKVLM